MAGLQVISVQSRYGKLPARHGKISGSDLNNSPGEQMPAMAKFFSPEPSSRHECSPSIRHGEFMQNGPCFAKFINFPMFHLHSSFMIVQKHKTYNMR
ncbi:hypothetical protein QL285_008987 [Trifolium repens]|nr:hypothetical protein QL285_008987 [Trifolium repens]